MKNKTLIKLLKEQDLAFRSTISNNIEKITSEQLKDIFLALHLQISNYIDNPTILRHFYEDVIEDLEETWKESEKYHK